MKRCLYLTYDGLLDPLGQSQILPYLERFASKEIRLTVVSFEKVERAKETEKTALHQRLARQGIEWVPLRYHKWPPVLSTLFDLCQGLWVCARLCGRRPPQLVHARSFVAGFLALWVKRLTRARFLFDVRGFWPEERVEGGLWRSYGFLYRSAKWWETRFLREADGIVVLSHAAKGLLGERLKKENPSAPIEVILTCTDLHRFVPADPANENGLTRVVYVGSVGTWYLTKEMVEFFQVLQERLPEARWTLLTPRSEPLLRDALTGVNRASYEIRMLKHEEIPAVLQTAQASLCFIKPVDSKKASCPTKVGESLACGVPVVMTRGIGDCDGIVEQERVGVVVTDLSQRGYRDAIERLITLRSEGAALSKRCRRVAQDHFDLDRGAEKYLALYERLMNSYEGALSE